MEEEIHLDGLAHEIMGNKRNAGQILIEMQNESLKQIAIRIWDGSQGREWYDISLAELKTKVKCHLELLGPSTPTKPKKPGNSTTQLTLQETTPNSEFKYPSTVTEMEKCIIKAMKMDKRPSTLLDLAGKHPGTCCIHPNKNHHFFECLSLKGICRDNDWAKSLKQAIKHMRKSMDSSRREITIGIYKFLAVGRVTNNSDSKRIKHRRNFNQPQHPLNKFQHWKALLATSQQPSPV